jgi:arginyl-tRNA synthetase
MHVGHLRSSVIGDCLTRVFEFMGERVIRQNHIGDWGTPFGMLIEHLIDLGDEEARSQFAVGDLNAFYKAARAKFDSDAAFAERARLRVVALQAGEPETLKLSARWPQQQAPWTQRAGPSEQRAESSPARQPRSRRKGDSRRVRV